MSSSPAVSVLSSFSARHGGAQRRGAGRGAGHGGLRAVWAPGGRHAGLGIAPEQFAQLLRDSSVTREHFIALCGLQPLVYIPELPGRTEAAFVLICLLVFALALFGSCLLVTRSKAVRTITNIFICSLALSDLLTAFFGVPFTALQTVSSRRLGGGCRPRAGAAPPFPRL